MKNPRELPIIGWREWLALPDLGIAAIKAKVDTGARSSALHAFDLEHFRRRGREMVRFRVHPIQRNSRESVVSEAAVIDRRRVRSSGGHETVRPVILTTLELFSQSWLIELTLTSRDEMGFRMLLGRGAIRSRFLIDPRRSFLAGKRSRILRRTERI